MNLFDVIPPLPPQIDRDRFGDYLSGLTDGEGHFGAFYYLDRHRKQTPLNKARVSFGIKLRADDRPVLELVQSYFGCGRFEGVRQKLSGGGLSHPQVGYLVMRTEDLTAAIIPHFDAHPLYAKKAADYCIWWRAVVLVAEVRKRKQKCRLVGHGHVPKWTPSEWQAFVAIVDELKAQRRFVA